MAHQAARVIYTPPTESLRFLPEGPYRCPNGRISWVAIQHGPQSLEGSLNLLDLNTGTNQQYTLPGRPGFAFPTSKANRFVVGLERSVGWYDIDTHAFHPFLEGVDHRVTNTIINDAVVFEGHLVFGLKELQFTEKKAGLYLIRAGEQTAIQLSDQQICSNGKAIRRESDGTLTLFDICSCSKQVLAWKLDVENGQITSPQVVVDVTQEPIFPDGMIMTPDEQHVIIAFYDPRAREYGEARMYEITSGQVVATWRCPGSPRVTCPQLIEHQGRISLLLTTADEGMSPELRAGSPNAGCLFLGDTDFSSLNDAPVYPYAEV